MDGPHAARGGFFKWLDRLETIRWWIDWSMGGVRQRAKERVKIMEKASQQTKGSISSIQLMPRENPC